MFIRSCAMALLGLGIAGSASGQDVKEADTNHFTMLIQQLTSGDFKVRAAAEKALRAAPRRMLPILMAHKNADDVEIRTTVRHAIKAILSDPARIPTACYIFNAEGTNDKDRKEKWTASIDAWRQQASISTSNVTGDAATAQPCAQSFIARHQEIPVIELAAYPINADSGWVRLDVHEDDKGLPDKTVLSRCWMRFDSDCPVSHSQWTPFIMPELTVATGRTYWICLQGFPDDESRAVMNYKFSSNNEYKDGEQLRSGDLMSAGGEDALFRVVSKCDPVQGLRSANDTDRRTMPTSQPRIEWRRPANPYSRPPGIIRGIRF